MGIKRSECSDAEFSAKLLKAYDGAAAAAERDEDSPRHDLNRWLAAARGSPVSANDSAPHGIRRTWAGASPEVRQALDAGFANGRSASDAAAVARAHLRHAGYSDRDGKVRELESYVATATSPRVNASETVVAGYGRLR